MSNLVVAPSPSEPTMTSKQIVEMLEARHDSVKHTADQAQPRPAAINYGDPRVMLGLVFAPVAVAWSSAKEGWTTCPSLHEIMQAPDLTSRAVGDFVPSPVPVLRGGRKWASVFSMG